MLKKLITRRPSFLVSSTTSTSITSNSTSSSNLITNFNKLVNVGPLLFRRGIASKTVYVSNVSYSSTEQGLEELGSRFGKVESVRMPRDYEGRSRGYGFIEFSQEEEAIRALDELNGIEFEANHHVTNKYI
ncbi:hypothetical protein Glove_306g39 [Diversispora epigaea]|uniref:RRM domain-containing protein n=1 Tax=Diversispora epigaea TaxID=1348612 RepID=A0A397HYL7_9GLOM|nr:hypothetical protein Glove_306g39 [Diversispora epigaea]